MRCCGHAAKFAMWSWGVGWADVCGVLCVSPETQPRVATHPDSLSELQAVPPFGILEPPDTYASNMHARENGGCWWVVIALRCMSKCP